MADVTYLRRVCHSCRTDTGSPVAGAAGRMPEFHPAHCGRRGGFVEGSRPVVGAVAFSRTGDPHDRRIPATRKLLKKIRRRAGMI